MINSRYFSKPLLWILILAIVFSPLAHKPAKAFAIIPAMSGCLVGGAVSGIMHYLGDTEGFMQDNDDNIEFVAKVTAGCFLGGLFTVGAHHLAPEIALRLGTGPVASLVEEVLVDIVIDLTIISPGAEQIFEEEGETNEPFTAPIVPDYYARYECVYYYSYVSAPSDQCPSDLDYRLSLISIEEDGTLIFTFQYDTGTPYDFPIPADLISERGSPYARIIIPTDFRMFTFPERSGFDCGETYCSSWSPWELISRGTEIIQIGEHLVEAMVYEGEYTVETEMLVIKSDGSEEYVHSSLATTKEVRHYDINSGIALRLDSSEIEECDTCEPVNSIRHFVYELVETNQPLAVRNDISIEEFNNQKSSSIHTNPLEINSTTDEETDAPPTEETDAATTNCTISSSSAINLRSGAGTNFSAGGTLSAGESRAVEAQTIGVNGFVWWQLSDGLWARSDVVVEAGDCESVPSA